MVCRSSVVPISTMPTVAMCSSQARDYQTVLKLYQERFSNKPFVIVLAPVCRPGWLVEMECMAVKAQQKPDMPAF